MALTLEEAGGTSRCPTSPASTCSRTTDAAPSPSATVARRRRPAQRLVHGPRRGSRSRGTDEPGGSGIEQIQYRINGGTPQLYAARSTSPPRARSRFEYRSIDRAGNAENFDGVDAQGRRRPRPPRPRRRSRAAVRSSGWHDKEVTVGAARRRRPGLGHRQDRVPRQPGERTPRGRTYTAPVQCRRLGHAGRPVPLDDVGGQRRGRQDAERPRRRDRADHHRADQRRRAGGGLHRRGARGLHAQRRRRRLGRRRDRVPHRRRRVDGLRGRVRPRGQRGATRSTSARSTSSATSRTSSA